MKQRYARSALKILKKKSDNVSKFVEETGMDLDAGVLSDQDAFKFDQIEMFQIVDKLINSDIQPQLRTHYTTV